MGIPMGTKIPFEGYGGPDVYLENKNYMKFVYNFRSYSGSGTLKILDSFVNTLM